MEQPENIDSNKDTEQKPAACGQVAPMVSCRYKISIITRFHGFIGCSIKAPKGMIPDSTCLNCDKFYKAY